MNTDPIRLCALDDVPEDGTNGFLIETEKGRFGTMVIRQGERFYVYVNSCPHIGAPLDFKAGQFLNVERTHIICTTHGALFQIEDGYCISGPCAGASLIPLKATLDAGEIFVTLPQPAGVG